MSKVKDKTDKAKDKSHSKDKEQDVKKHKLKKKGKIKLLLTNLDSKYIEVVIDEEEYILHRGDSIKVKVDPLEFDRLKLYYDNKYDNVKIEKRGV